MWTRLGGASWSRPRKELARGTHHASVSPSLFGLLSSLLGGLGGGNTQLSSVQSRLTSSGLHNQGEDAPSCSPRDWSPREEADWCELSLPCALSQGQNEAGASCGPSGPEHGLGRWGKAAGPTEGGHSPGQEQMGAGQTKAWVMQDLSCQHLDLNERSWGQNKPHLRTRVKWKRQNCSPSLDWDSYLQHVLVVSPL